MKLTKLRTITALSVAIAMITAIGLSAPANAADARYITISATGSTAVVPDAVIAAVASASFEVFPITETVAVIRTASGTTFVDPVALIVMYRVSAALAGADRPTAAIMAIATDRTVIVRSFVSFML